MLLGDIIFGSFSSKSILSTPLIGESVIICIGTSLYMYFKGIHVLGNVSGHGYWKDRTQCNGTSSVLDRYIKGL